MSYKASWLQKIWSWILPYNIETVQSKVSGQLEVNMQYGNIVIDSPDANYSFGNLHLVFREAIKQLKLDNSQQYKVLILGFGAGSIAHILKNELQINCGIVGVELDEEIIKLSKKYYTPSLFRRTQIKNIDAEEFMIKNKMKFDLILIDLFIDTKTPSVFQQIDFMTQVKQSLEPKGQILMNTLAENNTIKQNWTSVFDSCNIIYVQENELLKF